MLINQKEQLGSKTDGATQGNKASNLAEKTVEVATEGEALNLTREFVRETHRVLEHTQNHPPRNQHQKGPVCLWVVEEVTESWQRAEQVALFPLRPLLHIEHHNAVTWVAPP